MFLDERPIAVLGTERTFKAWTHFLGNHNDAKIFHNVNKIGDIRGRAFSDVITLHDYQELKEAGYLLSETLSRVKQ